MQQPYRVPQLRQYKKNELFHTLRDSGIIIWSYNTFSNWMYSEVFPDPSPGLKNRKTLMIPEVRNILEALDVDYIPV
jgi:hypothetical protein